MGLFRRRTRVWGAPPKYRRSTFFLFLLLAGIAGVILISHESSSVQITRGKHFRLLDTNTTDNDEGYQCADEMVDNPKEYRCLCSQDNPYDSLLNYSKFFWCDLGSARPVGAIIICIAWFFYFYLMGTTTDGFVVPIFERSAKFLNLSQQTAGVTLVAMGVGAPDLLTAFATFTNGSGGALGLGAVIGSDFGNITFILAIIVFMNKQDLTVKRGGMIRDLVFALLAEIFTFYIFSAKTVHVWQGVILLIGYAVYVLVAVYGHKWFGIDAATPHAHEAAETHEVEATPTKSKTVELIAMEYKNAPSSSSSEVESTTEEKTAITPAERRSLHTIQNPDLALFMQSEGRVHNLLCDPVPEGGILSPSKARSLSTDLRELQIVLATPSTSPEEEKVKAEKAHALLLSVETAAKQIKSTPEVSPEKDDTFPLTVQGTENAKLKESVQTSILDMWKARDWKGVSKWLFISLIRFLEGPFVVLRVITVPMFYSHNLDPADAQKPEEDKDFMTENKTCLCLSLTLGPVVCFIYFGATIVTTVIISFFCASFSIYMFRNILTLPQNANGAVHYTRWQQFWFLAIGLFVGVFWVFVIAEELVACISVIGDALGLSAATLGLTILAIGNNLQDLLADVLVANKGLSEMAVGGIFGTPCFDVMLTLGMGFTYAAAAGGSYDFDFDGTVPLAFVLVIIGFIMHLIYLPIMGWRYTKWWGMFLMGYYFFSMGLLVATEANHLPIWNTQTGL